MIFENFLTCLTSGFDLKSTSFKEKPEQKEKKEEDIFSPFMESSSHFRNIPSIDDSSRVHALETVSSFERKCFERKEEKEKKERRRRNIGIPYSFVKSLNMSF